MKRKRFFYLAGFLAAMFLAVILALYPELERRWERREMEALLLQMEREDLPVRFVFPKAVSENALTEKDAMPEPAEKEKKAVIEGDAIGILVIPRIEARLPVTAGVSEKQLKISEGWVLQTDPVGDPGNAVIAGHRSHTWGRHFNRLGELEEGDNIYFDPVDGERIQFTVHEILTVEPDDPAVFANPGEGVAQLTLYTCTPMETSARRLVIRALRTDE